MIIERCDICKTELNNSNPKINSASFSHSGDDVSYETLIQVDIRSVNTNHPTFCHTCFWKVFGDFVKKQAQ